MSGAVVSAVRVGKRFGTLVALDDVTIDVAKGEVVCIIGPSGSGKTTFLRCINQLERIDSGALWLDGELTGYRRVGDALHPLTEAEIARQRRSTGMVFQRFNLFPHMTALGNVTEGPVQVLRMKPAAAREAAMVLLERVGLAHKAGRLSGGTVRRAAAACRDRPLPGDEPQADAVRRADLGARSRARRRGSERDAGPGAIGHDDGRRHA